jgi:hypothetical protein
LRYLTHAVLLTQRLALAGAAELRRRRDRDRSEPGPTHARPRRVHVRRSHAAAQSRGLVALIEIARQAHEREGAAA